MLGKVYLLCYNACLFLGWSVVLVTAVKEMVEAGSPQHVYKLVNDKLQKINCF